MFVSEMMPRQGRCSHLGMNRVQSPSLDNIASCLKGAFGRIMIVKQGGKKGACCRPLADSVPKSF